VEATQSPRNRREFLKSTGLATAGAMLAPNCEELFAKQTAKRPLNLLFILADQWRWSAFSHETDPLVRTPNFDDFANQGARFTRAYAANPVCTPNRTTIMTGRYSHQHGMINNNLMIPPSERCLAESFQEAGYQTHYIGKWHMDGEEKPGFVPPGWRRRGFSSFEGFNRGHYYPNGAKYFTNDGKLLHPNRFESAYQTDLAIEFMKQNRNTQQPFFCYLSWGPPHSPYRPPKEFDRYDPKKLRFRPNVPEKLRNNQTLQRELAGYYGLCEALDHEMGRLVKSLEENGLAENTLVIFTSDHGDMHGSHSQYRKGKPEEESLHVPLMMRLPKRIRAGQKTDVLFNSIDLMPTMISMCNVKNPGTCTGRDLSKAVLGDSTPQVDSLYSEGAMRLSRRGPQASQQKKTGKQKKTKSGSRFKAREEWRALVTPTHKLVMNVSGKVTRLIDLEKDPYELKNLADERAHAALLKEMQKRAKRWAKETDDPAPNLSTPAKKMYSDEEAAKSRAG
jgi:arylsulfatase A-like enzyme